jgi:hypothetical protein
MVPDFVFNIRSAIGIAPASFTFAVMKRFSILVLAFMATIAAQAQSGKVEGKSGVFYFGIGTHKIFYTKSDLHLVGNGSTPFDLTLKKVKAKDDFFLKKTGGAPQYDYKIGYYFKKKNFGIEFNFDHVKYFVRHNQTVRTTGTVNGEKIDADLPVTTYVQNFEHSDGANYALFNFVKWKNLSNGQKPSNFDWELKAGVGPVIPKTNSTILNKHWDDRYKLAGYVVALETGLRYNYKALFVQPSFKAAYANYTNFLIADGHGNQNWLSGQFILSVGAQIR